jgi:hypothetical protein
MIRKMLVACLVIGFTAIAIAADQIDNPQYASWAKHKPGTKVTLQTATNAQGMSMTQDMTETLMQVTPEKAVVEFTMSMDMGGTKHDMTRQHDVPAKVEKGHENLPSDMTGTSKVIGQETVDVGGKKYDCKVVEFTGEGQRGKASGKIWVTEQVPGGMVKTEIKMDAPRQATMTTVVTGIEEK